MAREQISQFKDEKRTILSPKLDINELEIKLSFISSV